MTYGGGNPGPRLGQAQQLVGCKYSTKNNDVHFDTKRFCNSDCDTAIYGHQWLCYSIEYYD